MCLHAEGFLFNITYLFGDHRLQFSFHMGPVNLLQIGELADDKDRAALRLRVPGWSLELEQYVRHLPPEWESLQNEDALWPSASPPARLASPCADRVI